MHSSSCFRRYNNSWLFLLLLLGIIIIQRYLVIDSSNYNNHYFIQSFQIIILYSKSLLFLSQQEKQQQQLNRFYSNNNFIKYNVHHRDKSHIKRQHQQRSSSSSDDVNDVNDNNDNINNTSSMTATTSSLLFNWNVYSIMDDEGVTSLIINPKMDDDTDDDATKYILIAGTKNGNIRQFIYNDDSKNKHDNVNNVVEVSTFMNKHKTSLPVFSLLSSPNINDADDYLFSGSADRYVTVWKKKNSNNHQYDWDIIQKLGPHTGWVKDICYYYSNKMMTTRQHFLYSIGCNCIEVWELIIESKTKKQLVDDNNTKEEEWKHIMKLTLDSSSIEYSTTLSTDLLCLCICNNTNHQNEKNDVVIMLAAGGVDGRIHFWDIKSLSKNNKKNTIFQSITVHTGRVNDILYDSYTGLLFTTSHDGSIKGWLLQPSSKRHHDEQQQSSQQHHKPVVEISLLTENDINGRILTLAIILIEKNQKPSMDITSTTTTDNNDMNKDVNNQTIATLIAGSHHGNIYLLRLQQQKEIPIEQQDDVPTTSINNQMKMSLSLIAKITLDYKPVINTLSYILRKKPNVGTKDNTAYKQEVVQVNDDISNMISSIIVGHSRGISEIIIFPPPYP